MATAGVFASQYQRRSFGLTCTRECEYEDKDDKACVSINIISHSKIMNKKMLIETVVHAVCSYSATEASGTMNSMTELQNDAAGFNRFATACFISDSMALCAINAVAASLRRCACCCANCAMHSCVRAGMSEEISSYWQLSWCFSKYELIEVKKGELAVLSDDMMVLTRCSCSGRAIVDETSETMNA